MTTIWGKGKAKEGAPSTTPIYFSTAKYIGGILGKVNQLQEDYQTRVKDLSPFSKDILLQLLRTVIEEINKVNTIVTEINQLKARLAATDYDSFSS